MFAWMSVNDDYLKQRRISQLAFTRKSMEAYKEAQEEEVSILLQSLLETPTNFERHIHRQVPHRTLYLKNLLTLPNEGSQLVSSSISFTVIASGRTMTGASRSRRTS